MTDIKLTMCLNEALELCLNSFHFWALWYLRIYVSVKHIPLLICVSLCGYDTYEVACAP